MFAVSEPEGAGITLSWQILGVLSIPALVALNGFFVAAEFSLVAVRRTRIEQLVAEGVKGARAVQTTIERLDRSIAATQLGITLASIGLGLVSEPALHRLLIQPLFDQILPGWATHSLALGVAFGLVTFLHVVFGELIPKTIALQTPDTTAIWVARPMLWFVYLTRPVVLIMNGSANWLVRRLGFKEPTGEAMLHSIEELALLIEDTEEAGILDPEQANLVQHIFELSDKTVGDCMVSRDKMASLELSTPPDQVLEAVRTGAHTRMPIYEKHPDNIVGIVNTKDLFYLFSLRGVVVLEDALYPALFLKPDESVANALRLFKRARRPMALVRDDDGHVLGLITLEDILEEIVGDIEDEHDRPTPKVRRRLRSDLRRGPGSLRPPRKG